MPKDQYMCQLCANHGIFNQPKKGHKQKCPYKTCECNLCALNTKRRALDQIERQLKNTSNPSDPEQQQEESIAVVNSSNLNTEAPTPSTAGGQSPPSSQDFKVPQQPSPATKPTHNHSNMRPSTSKVPANVMSIALPATLSKKPVFKSLGQKSRKIPSDGDLSAKRRKPHGSIFHSAEKLAQSG